MVELPRRTPLCRSTRSRSCACCGAPMSSRGGKEEIWAATLPSPSQGSSLTCKHIFLHSLRCFLVIERPVQIRTAEDEERKGAAATEGGRPSPAARRRWTEIAGGQWRPVEEREMRLSRGEERKSGSAFPCGGGVVVRGVARCCLCGRRRGFRGR
jgi:hypothetical protein